MMIVENIVGMAQRLLADRLKSARYVVDATAGNGHDTLFLAQSSPDNAKIWAFDIQAPALNNTHNLLLKNNLDHKVQLINECHTQIAKYVKNPVDVVMFNLGYLPGGDHSFTTQPVTTIQALERLLPFLAVRGLISIVVYPGHSSGRLEYEAIQNFAPLLPQNEFSVGCWQLVNHYKHPPLLYLIERTKGGIA